MPVRFRKGSVRRRLALSLSPFATRVEPFCVLALGASHRVEIQDGEGLEMQFLPASLSSPCEDRGSLKSYTEMQRSHKLAPKLVNLTSAGIL